MLNNLFFKAARQRTRNNARSSCGRILARYVYGDAGQMETEYTVPVPRSLTQAARAAIYDADNLGRSMGRRCCTISGPVAQDFRAAFDLGADDKHIATVDADGVGLAATQGLNQKIEAQPAELKRRERGTETSALEKLIRSTIQKRE